MINVVIMLLLIAYLSRMEFFNIRILSLTVAVTHIRQIIPVCVIVA